MGGGRGGGGSENLFITKGRMKSHFKGIVLLIKLWFIAIHTYRVPKNVNRFGCYIVVLHILCR